MAHGAAGKGHGEQQDQEPFRHCSLTMGFRARQRDIAANAKNKGLFALSSPKKRSSSNHRRVAIMHGTAYWIAQTKIG
jgi:hypothetical protein